MERMTLVVNDIAQALGVNKASAYALMDTPGFPAIRIGKRIVVPKDAFQRWLDSSCGKTVLEVNKGQQRRQARR